MNNCPTISCLGYPIYTGDLHLPFCSEKIIINTLNQYSYCVAEQDSNFKKALKHADILLPDGIGIVAAVKFLNGKRIKKIAGADIHCYLLEELNKKGGTCFYLGSSPVTIDKIKEKIATEYSKIKVEGYSPPFKTEFSSNDNKNMINAVNTFQPDVLFVGMTAPKQEKWVELQKDFLEANIICSIGAVFDFYAGTKQRPGKIWDKFGLEWLGRLCKEPRRLSKRYLYYGVVFGFYIIKNKFSNVNKEKKSV